MHSSWRRRSLPPESRIRRSYRLKPIGTVAKITSSHNFLVPAEKPVEFDPKDMKVVDENLNEVGIVRDVIGSVRAPYYLVKILVPLDQAREYVGRRLYLLEPSPDLTRKLRKGR